MDICSNIDRVREKINAACTSSGRNPADVTLIAVSKTKPVESIRSAADCGQIDFGENKVQELTGKMEQLGDDLQWHMIGALQTNKIKYLVERANWIHSIGKIKQLKEVEKRAAGAERVMNVLIQINISGEDQKSGFEPDELGEVLKAAVNLKWTKVQGLIGMASFVGDEDTIRGQFRLLRELRDAHKEHESEAVKMHHLSMGMTNDLELAIEEGSTMVRVGTAIFGDR